MQMFANAKAEVESHMRQHLERMMAGMDMVSRDEFEAVKAVAAKARGEQEKLAERVAELEAKLGVAAPAAPAAKKPAAARKPAKPKKA
ncbi:MAG: accessory factor UbiK family protein [Magnetospirillum sp. WYHS-4]